MWDISAIRLYTDNKATKTIKYYMQLEASSVE
jgi:hypothetical protein